MARQDQRSYYYVDQGSPGDWRLFFQESGEGGRRLVHVYDNEADADADADMLNDADKYEAGEQERRLRRGR